MKLVVYGDESGTHDQAGILNGSCPAIIAGFMAPDWEWANFCSQWQVVLNRYKAPYFHFSEWSTASGIARGKPRSKGTIEGNPYKHLSATELDDFLIELAALVGSGTKQLIVGDVWTKQFHEAKIAGNPVASGNPYEISMEAFFNSVVSGIACWPSWKNKRVSFFLDQTGDKDWISMFKSKHREFQGKHRTFKAPAFVDKKVAPYLPLQAADMAAYRLRQIAEDWAKEGDRKWEALDEVLFKPSRDILANFDPEILSLHSRGLLGRVFKLGR